MLSHKKHKKEKRAYRPARTESVLCFSWPKFPASLKRPNSPCERFTGAHDRIRARMLGRAFAIMFRRFARALLGAASRNLKLETGNLKKHRDAVLIAGYSLALRIKAAKPCFKFQISSFTSQKPVPTDPTVTRLNPRIVEGLSA